MSILTKLVQCDKIMIGSLRKSAMVFGRMYGR